MMDKPSIGSEEYWNDRYSKLDNIDWTPSRFLAGNIKLIPRDGTALVLGCGTGKNALFLAKSLKIVGIDISKNAIAIAKERSRELKDAGELKFEIMDARDYFTSERKEQFDLITSLNFFDPNLVAGMKRALKPGGTLFIQAFTSKDERLKDSNIKDVLIDDTTFFEPAIFGGYWFIKHEVENFKDREGKNRQRINLIARKPHS
ncbi:MAG: class I SAM-dependent methyltransferase [Candidatus Hodarchaeota archaeon]